MYNQDDVAVRLVRLPIVEMHKLMYIRGVLGITGINPWGEIIELDSTKVFLLSHGWVLADYIDECKRYAAQLPQRSMMRYMCCQFSNTPYA